MYEANILLVDDETAILQLLTTILEKKVFSYYSCNITEMALSLTQQNDYDLIILDVMLPGQSGFDICPIIRQKQIVLSSSSQLKHLI